MKKIFFYPCILFGLLFCTFIHAAEQKAAGLSYTLLKQDPHTIHILKIDPARYRLELVKAEPANGRETVPSIVARTKSVAGINGGFFQINNGIAKATGTLIVNGEAIAISRGMRSVLVMDRNKSFITKAQVSKAGKSIKLKTLSGKVITNPQNVVTGIPMLVMNNQIAPNLDKSGSVDFVTRPHARTAVGIQKDGTIIMVVVENIYGAVGTATLGLTLPELAQFMLQDMHCEQAINLDGGGSSTLVYEGQLKNKTFGDLDEAMGLQTIRAVSDAIVVVKR